MRVFCQVLELTGGRILNGVQVYNLTCLNHCKIKACANKCRVF